MSLEYLLYVYKRTNKSIPITHCRFAFNKEKKIYPGAYHIPKFSYNKFLALYYKNIFIDNNEDCITEKSLYDDFPIVIDLDLKYTDQSGRKYNDNDIDNFISLCVSEINNMMVVDESFNCYVMEKNYDNNGKDGIHIFITVLMSISEQMELRKNIINNMDIVLSHIKLNNSYDDVYDKSVSSGANGWMMYGSNKPGKSKYILTKKYAVEYNTIYQTNIDIDDFQKIKILSINNRNCPKFAMRYHIDDIEIPIKKKKINVKYHDNIYKNLDDIIQYCDNIKDVKHKKIRDMVMNLPAQYYDNYEKWMKVGWALHNTNKSLFPIWILFSSKSSKFNGDIDAYYNIWKKSDPGLGIGSIEHWLKNSDEDVYNKIVKKYNTSNTYYIHIILTIIIIILCILYLKNEI